MHPNSRHSYPTLVTIRCGLATFSGVPSLVNLTFTTYFLPASPAKLPRNLKMYWFVYLSSALVVLDPLDTIWPSSQTVQSARSSGSLLLQSFDSSGPAVTPIMHCICRNGRGFST